MIRVLHVIAGLRTGGAEHAVGRLVRHARDVEHAAVTSVLGDGPMRAHLEQAGVEVRCHGAHATSGLPSAVLGLRRDIASLQPDVIQSWMYPADLLSSLATRRVPVVWGVRHGHLPGPEAARATRLAGRLLARLHRPGHPAAIVYNSEAARLAHERAGYPADRGEVIHNGIDVPEVDRAEQRRRLHEVLGAPDDRPVVIRVGRANRQKDHAGLLRAWALLPDTSRARLVLVGPGIPEDDVVRQAAAVADDARPVHLVGVRQDARSLVAGADLAISNSIDGESFPTVVAEALAVGTGVIATDVGDTPTILGSEDWLVPPGDGDALASAMTRWLGDPPTTHASNPWSPAREAERFSAVWHRAADGDGLERDERR